jgi:hypothetical protein
MPDKINWHRKTAATRLGITEEAYEAKQAQQLKWCTACKAWHPKTKFGNDTSRGDKLAAKCKDSQRTGRRVGWHGQPAINPLTGRPGPAPHPPRDGDKKQARRRINVAVRSGRLPHPNTLRCADCDHLGPDRRHEYDHFLGYAAEHHEHVEPVCSSCHVLRSLKRGENAGCKPVNKSHQNAKEPHHAY